MSQDHNSLAKASCGSPVSGSPWAPVKAADLREGDRIKVTLGGVVIASPYGCSELREIRFDGDVEHRNALTSEVLDAGTLERQERPLEVGDAVHVTNGTARGTIKAIVGGRGWVDWSSGMQLIHQLADLTRGDLP